MVRTFAAIDVGSYALELGIYEMSEKIGFRPVDHVKHVIGLGNDTFADGKISYPLVEEMCEKLSGFSDIMKSYHVEAYRACGASALREARNSQIVLDQIRVRTGLDVEIISNAELHFMNYKAIAARDAEFQKTILKGTAIVSVGFGSTQISLFDKDALVSTQNLPLGVLKLTDLMMKADVHADMEHNLVREMIDNEMVTYRKIYLKDREVKNLIAIGDPILTLYHRMKESNVKDRISADEFNAFYEKLSRMTPEQMEEAFDISAAGANLMFPSAAVYKRLMEVTGAETLWIPGIHMTDGIAAAYADKKKLVHFHHDFDNDIIVTSRNMAKRYKCHMPHVQSVETAALQVFDALKKYHGLKSRERLLVQIAAVLHSCGKFVTMGNATDCAYHIIMGTEIIGLSLAEREIVANVVRYHVQKFSYDDVRLQETVNRNTALAAPDSRNMMIAKMVAILRLANSMDRGHKNKLAGCTVAVKDKELVITTDYAGDVTLERLSIASRGDFFEEIFGIRPVLKQKKRV
jgi:exopolyphosphatase/guanosine-5'-triphosphate,3'-diphosphate pyrophosphatase